MTCQNVNSKPYFTGHVPNLARHCPLTGHYFEPWPLHDETNPAQTSSGNHKGIISPIKVTVQFLKKKILFQSLFISVHFSQCVGLTMDCSEVAAKMVVTPAFTFTDLRGKFWADLWEQLQLLYCNNLYINQKNPCHVVFS